MAVREVRQKEDNILRQISEDIKKVDDNVRLIVADMLDTMYAYDGIGLAACQIGELLNIVVYDVAYIDNAKKKKPVVLINPKIVSSSKDMVSVEEGCLSFPEIFEKVERHKKVKVEYLDMKENKKIVSAKDIEAVVIQHEMDHLQGIVFLDKAVKE